MTYRTGGTCRVGRPSVFADDSESMNIKCIEGRTQIGTPPLQYTLKIMAVANAISQASHLNGRSPVCVLKWLFLEFLEANPFLHTWHS